MKVRTATTPDHDLILDVVRQAFRGGDDEVRIVNDVRRLGAAITDLELVATVDNTVIGHVLTSRADLHGRAVAAVAPLAVHPDWQGRGVGGALMTELIGHTDRQGWPVLALLGNPAYYGRFGFEPAKPLGIVYPPVDGPAFQIRRLTTYDRTWRGTFTYAWEQPQ
ncbi:MAG: N-acetyltransferase [Actinomycetota bacterium]|nr:N-acetyltransferase [Actinomycetota bacterium]